jgi:hypothetical protein
MTVREWFRVVRAAQDARLWNRPLDPTPQPEHKLLEAIRIGTWREVEFWMLLHLSGLMREAWTAPVGKNGHTWELTGIMWSCTVCPATVPSDEIGETDPDPQWFDPECRCAACQPCTGRPA